MNGNALFRTLESFRCRNVNKMNLKSSELAEKLAIQAATSTRQHLSDLTWKINLRASLTKMEFRDLSKSPWLDRVCVCFSVQSVNCATLRLTWAAAPSWVACRHVDRPSSATLETSVSSSTSANVAGPQLAVDLAQAWWKSAASCWCWHPAWHCVWCSIGHSQTWSRCCSHVPLGYFS